MSTRVGWLIVCLAVLPICACRTPSAAPSVSSAPPDPTGSVGVLANDDAARLHRLLDAESRQAAPDPVLRPDHRRGVGAVDQPRATRR